MPLKTELQLRVGRYTPMGGVLEYRVDLEAGYLAVVTKLSTQWRLTIHGRAESELGLFDSAAAALIKLEEHEMMMAGRRGSVPPRQQPHLTAS